jgi:hypothetical protein
MMHLRTSLVFMLLVSPFSSADTLQVNLLKCAQNSDSLQRLGCYDKLAENLKIKEQHIRPTQTNHVEDKKSAETSEVQETAALAKFGNENKQDPEESIEQIQAKVSKISNNKHGQYVITLDNQQVWRQTDKIRMKFKQGQVVDIERGFMGSFFMGTERLNKRMRVKRVK